MPRAKARVAWDLSTPLDVGRSGWLYKAGSCSTKTTYLFWVGWAAARGITSNWTNHSGLVPNLGNGFHSQVIRTTRILKNNNTRRDIPATTEMYVCMRASTVICVRLSVATDFYTGPRAAALRGAHRSCQTLIRIAQ